jgi:hypothetical protein
MNCAIETTQTKAIQSCIGGQGRGAREDWHAATDPSSTLHQEAQGNCSEAQAHNGQSAE